MLDFTLIRSGAQSFADLVRGLSVDDLHRLTDEMVDLVLNITAAASDQDVRFEYSDPEAPADVSPTSSAPGWTLGHVVAHMTAGSEETAALSSSLARSVPTQGRARHEVPWETIRNMAQLRQRIEESRRMRHAFLNTWPDESNLELTTVVAPRFGPLNAIACFVLGLFHEDAHLEQLREVLRQALAARGA